MKRIYLSGRITGTTDYMERFSACEKMLTRAGFEVVNPAKVNSNMPPSTTWKEYMMMSLTMLSLCDTIFMMDGWRKSKGAITEWRHAVNTGMNILYEGGV